MLQLAVLGGAVCAGVCGLLITPFGGSGVAVSRPTKRATQVDLSSLSADPISPGLRLLFIHHSCGGQLLAGPGEDRQPHGGCIYDSHPNGGDLRQALQKAGYEVHEASYGSAVGENTDLFDWPAKFRDQMDRVLRTDLQDATLPDGKRNQIVMFKSCFPNSEFEALGEPPGQPSGRLTVWNARASLNALLDEFKKHPDVLYVYLTAPPIAPRPSSERLYKTLLRTVKGKSGPPGVEEIARQAELAREFNDWVVGTDGWLKDYPLKNVIAFDSYDVLTGDGRSNLLEYATRDGRDSHPSAEGNRKVAAALVPFLNRAVRRAGLGVVANAAAPSPGEAAAAAPR